MIQCTASTISQWFSRSLTHYIVVKLHLCSCWETSSTSILFRTSHSHSVTQTQNYLMVNFTLQLEVHSVERIYLRQWCFDASKPRVAASTDAQYQYVGFSRRNKIPRCSAMGESNPVPASGLSTGSGSKVNQFVHVPTSVDTQHFIQIHHACVFQ